jgi:hypothetical protein
VTTEAVKATFPRPNRTTKYPTAVSVAVLLAVVALAGWAYVTADSSGRNWLVATYGGLLVLLVIQLASVQRRVRRFVAANAVGMAALARGELQTALDIFAAWHAQPRPPRFAAVAQHNHGWTLIRQGQLQPALDMLTNNDETKRVGLKAYGLFPTSSIDIALCYALLDRLDVAETWIVETENRAGELHPPSLGAMKAFARAVVDCRSNRCAEAARMLAEHWAEYEATLTGDVMRPLRIVRAFAIADAGPRDAGLAQTVLPAYPGEFDFLGVAWPEMASFLATNGLTVSRAAAEPVLTAN